MTEGQEAQIARLDEKITTLQREVTELRTTVEGWIQNTAKERLTIILAFVAGWLSLMVAAVSAYLHK